MPRYPVEAAGGVLWRPGPDGPEVALVHRPRYDDWSLPKGKLDAGEHPLLGALREIEEETGFTARPGRRLGRLRYPVAEGTKRVRYWACEATGGAFVASREVDALRWAPVPAALRRLSADHDRPVLAAFAADPRPTRALLVVRHASAGDKHAWRGSDAERPLDAAGRARADELAALLRAFGVTAAGAADVLRCRDTLAPFAAATGVPVAVLPATTAGAYGESPAAGADAALGLLGPADPPVRAAAWCGQREVIAALVADLAARLDGDPLVARRRARLAKGGLVALHVDDRGRLVAVDRVPDKAGPRSRGG